MKIMFRVTEKSPASAFGRKLMKKPFWRVFFVIGLFDAAYASRLWCIWELAIYLKLREKPKVEFISISANSMAVGAVVFSTITSAVSYVTYVYIAESAELTDNCVKWHLVAIAALLKTFIFIFGQQHFINVISLKKNFPKKIFG
jgi:hypothetical protein